jgi:hypothetical protein
VTQYQPLFKIEVEHSFFAGGDCRGLRFKPTASSRYLLDKMGCVTRFAAGGLEVWSDSSQSVSPASWHDDSRQVVHVDFLVYPQDPLFGSYTLPLPPPDGTVLVFDSAQFRPTGSDGRTRLHDSEFASKNDLHSLAELVLSEVLTRRESLVPPTFIIRIAVSALRVHDTLGWCYYVRFGATATLWKYYLRDAWSSDSVQIVDIGREIDFHPAVMEALPDGRPVLTVRSRTEIELRERSSRRFQLRLRDGNAEKIIIKYLPVAGAAEQYAETVDSMRRRVSHIHVGC